MNKQINIEQIVIITPCYNENTIVIRFLQSIEKVVSKLKFTFNVLVVDDRSSDNTLLLLRNFKFESPNITLTILPLKFNVGHQKAIFQGLLFSQNLNSNKFIIMDSDGEDDPRAISELVNFNDFDIINVVRGRRKESIFFQLSYYTYRLIFKIITGKVLNFGNYCMINKNIVELSCHTSYIHFAAHLSKQKVKTNYIIYNRLKRIDGKSKMNLTSLVHHAFKSFIEYAEDLLMIFLKIFAFIMFSLLLIILFVLYTKFFTNNAILGWASTMILGMLNIAIVSLGFFVIGILLLNMISQSKQNKKEIFNSDLNNPLL